MVPISEINLKVGHFIQFGSYYQKPVLWRVIHNDISGNPLLLSNRILTIKPFDAAGHHHKDIGRKEGGSNEWGFSNIRQWLNSSESKVEWWQNQPCAMNFRFGQNPYNLEKGFLADGNFTETERNLIIPVTHKTLLSEVDAQKRDGGSERHIIIRNIRDVVQNYDVAFYRLATDKVFLLSVKELFEYVFLNNFEHRPFATQEAFLNNTYRPPHYSTLKYWHTWLRTPLASHSNYVRYIDYHTGAISYNIAHASYAIGVQPALFISKCNSIVKTGTGIEKDPFIIENNKLCYEIGRVNFTSSMNLFDPRISTIGQEKIFTEKEMVPGSLIPEASKNKNNVAVNKPLEPLKDGKNGTNITLGDYLLFGKYHDSPIRWKVIHIDEEGSFLIWSDRILCIRAYDVSGNYHKNLVRKIQGSNNWEFSNLRQWLNGDEKSIKWWQNNPSVSFLWGGENPDEETNIYLEGTKWARDKVNVHHFTPGGEEAGFLSDKNFMAFEREMIKPTTHETLLSIPDEDQKDGGSEYHLFERSINEVVQNYETSFFKHLTDKVFLLSVKELHDFVFVNGFEHRAMPTNSAVVNGIFKHHDLESDTYCRHNEQEIKKYWNAWLRTPLASSSEHVRTINNDGGVSYAPAHDCSMGVQPALFLRIDQGIWEEGNGSFNTPWNMSISESEFFKRKY